MTVTVEDMRVMLNLDDDEGEKLLLIYIASATSFVKKAISTEADDAFFDRDDVAPLFKTAVMARTGTLYTYRVDTGDSSTYPIDATTNSIVGQLRGVYAVYAEEVANG